MIGNLISAVAGRAVARQFGGVRAGPLGTVAGAALPLVLRRLGPVGMIAAAVGGYAVKRYLDREASRAGVEPGVAPPTTADNPPS